MIPRSLECTVLPGTVFSLWGCSFLRFIRSATNRKQPVRNAPTNSAHTAWISKIIYWLACHPAAASANFKRTIVRCKQVNKDGLVCYVLQQEKDNFALNIQLLSQSLYAIGCFLCFKMQLNGFDLK